MPQISSSKDVYNLVYPSWMKDIEHRESFKILLFPRANRVLGISNLFTGGLSGVVVDAKLIFQTVLKSYSGNLIFMHNHPSGSLIAGDADQNKPKNCRNWQITQHAGSRPYYLPVSPICQWQMKG